ncbi:MAG: hypothetical protein ACREEC_05995, partial [Thermoplasmata archaeon]
FQDAQLQLTIDAPSGIPEGYQLLVEIVDPSGNMAGVATIPPVAGPAVVPGTYLTSQQYTVNLYLRIPPGSGGEEALFTLPPTVAPGASLKIGQAVPLTVVGSFGWKIELQFLQPGQEGIPFPTPRVGYVFNADITDIPAGGDFILLENGVSDSDGVATLSGSDFIPTGSYGVYVEGSPAEPVATATDVQLASGKLVLIVTLASS